MKKKLGSRCYTMKSTNLHQSQKEGWSFGSNIEENSEVEVKSCFHEDIKIKD